MKIIGLLIPCALIVVLAGCVAGTKILIEPQPFEITQSLASASDERLVVTLDWVIVRKGPGEWAKNADWDEFLLRFENLSNSPIHVTNVTVFDSLGTQINTLSDRKELVEASKETKRRYGDSDIKIMAGWGAGAFGVIGAAAVATGLAVFSAAYYTSATIATGGLVLVLAAPVFFVGGSMRGNRNRQVNTEIIRRQTRLPLEIPSSQELPVDLFFPLVPSPTHLEVIYTDSENERRLIIDTQEALKGLHLVPEKK
jgi:hypothetical protein